MAKKTSTVKGIDAILIEVRAAIARKLNCHPDNPPEQINLTLSYENVSRKISIVILETEVD